jgi:hypothetical protein
LVGGVLSRRPLRRPRPTRLQRYRRGGIRRNGPGPIVDEQHQGGVIQSPAVQDRPRLPPASRAETEAFLGHLMPHEYVAPPRLRTDSQMFLLSQNVGTHDVRLSDLQRDLIVKVHLLEMASNQFGLRPLFADSRLQTFSSD